MKGYNDLGRLWHADAGSQDIDLSYQVLISTFLHCVITIRQHYE